MIYERPAAFRKAVLALKSGKAAVFPTETVYGLGLAIEYAQCPDLIFHIKERPSTKPVAWLIGSVEDLEIYGRAIPEFAKTLGRTFWPGPMTLVVKASERVPKAFQSQEGTIGLRMPDNKLALDLIQAVGSPLATSSANISGHKAPHTVTEIEERLTEKVDALVYDSQKKSGVASTVIDCTGEHPVILREGAITIADIQNLA